ncbi:gliding motility-associated C-terminal domain-containing protein [Maribacter sp. 2-571]|uniref:Ig-like domain-containing protein n=1 Tax=Maribacter sp. 2-571 TaxID=3417569 RepID=UPI003D3426D9
MPQIRTLVFLLFVFGLFASFSVPENAAYHAFGIVETNSAPPPSFTGCPPTDVVVTYTPGTCEATVNWTPPSASGATSVTSNYDPGDLFLPGTTAVIYRAENAIGEITTCGFNVIVSDNENPVFTQFPSDVVLNADPATCTAVHSWAYPQATDNCPAGQGVAPVLQDFESPTNQCYDFYQTTIEPGSPINGSNYLQAPVLSSIPFFSSEFTSPVLLFTGDGEISFSHGISAIGDNATLIVDILDQNGVVVIPNFFSEVYATTTIQQENLPITFSGNRKVRIRYYSDLFLTSGQTGYLDDLLLPGTIVTNINDPSCDLDRFLVQREDGTGLQSGDEFAVGVTTITYEVEDSAGNEIERSFTITVENNINPPTGQTTYSHCFGTTPPELSVSVGSGETANWYDSAGTQIQAGSTTYQPPTTTDLLRTYFVETENSSSGCTSVDRLEITLQQIPLPPEPTVTTPIEYCVGDTAVPLSATALTDHSLRWYSNATGGPALGSAPTPDTSVAATTDYYVSQVHDPSGCEGSRAVIEVVVFNRPSAPSVTSPVEYCIGDTAGTLDSNATGTNLTWYDAATGGNIIAGNTRPDTSAQGTQNFWVSQSASSGSITCESNRAQLIVNVNTPPTITSSPSNQSVCPGTNVTFSAGANNSGSFQWQRFTSGSWNDLSEAAPYSGTQSADLVISGTTIAMNSDRFRAIANSPAASCSPATSNEAILTVSDTTDPVITGCPVGPLTANTTAGSCGAVVTWTPPTATDDCGTATITSNGYAPGDEFLPGTTSVIYTATDLGGNSVSCSFDVVVTDTIDPVISGPTDITVAASSAGCSAIVNYATPTVTDNCVANTGTFPVVTDFEVASRNDLIAQCYIFFGSTVTTSAPLAGNTSFYTSEIEPSFTRGLVSPLVYLNGTGEISFIHALQAHPSGVNTITVLLEDEAAITTPIYTFNYTDLATNAARIPVTQTGNYRIRFEFDSDTKVNTSKRVRMDNLSIPGVQLSDPANSCAPMVLSITQTAGIASGGTFPLGTTTNTFETTDSNGNTGTYSFDVTVQNNTAAPGVTTPVSYCQGDAASALTASGSNLLWYTSAIGGSGTNTAPTPSTAASGSTSYWVSQTINDCEGPRSEIVVVVRETPTIAIATAPSCSVDLATYSVSVNVSTGTVTSTQGAVTDNGGNNWTVSGVTSGTDITITVTDTGNSCTNTLNVTAPNCSCPTVNAPTDDSGNLAFCAGDTVPTVSVSVGPDETVDWFASASGGTALITGSLTYQPAAGSLTDGANSFFAETRNTVTGCTSATRNEVIITRNTVPNAATVNTPVVYCSGDTASALTAVGSNLLWYANATGGTGNATAPTPSTTTAGSTSYYVSQSSASGCESARSEIVVTINNSPSPPGIGTPVSYCEGDTASPLTATGSNLLWYTAPTGGTGNTSAPTPSTATTGNTSYYVSQTNANGCESTRAEITVEINAIPSAPTVSSPVTYCQGDTASALTASGSNLLWYTAATGGTGNTTAPTPSTATVGNSAYFVSQTTNGCESGRSEIIVTVNAPPTITIVGTPSCAPAATYTVDLTVSGGTVTSTAGTTVDNGGNSWTVSGVPNGTDITVTVSEATTCTAQTNVTAPDCITAVDDNYTGSISGTTGQNNIYNVLDNDLVNGNTATLSNVSLRRTTTSAGNRFRLNSNGTTRIIPNTSVGTYSFEYEICDLSAPGTCDRAIAYATVDIAPIQAAEDSNLTPINGIPGSTAIYNVLTNDRLNQTPVTLSTVTLTEIAPDPTGSISMNPDGTVNLASNTEPGYYVIGYRICETANPSNCSNGLAKIYVDHDTDNDGVLNFEDLDDDNDGVPDLEESDLCSGILNYQFFEIDVPGRTTDNIPTNNATFEGSVNEIDVDNLQNLLDNGDRETFAIRYSGFIAITTGGSYTFYTQSDDGSKLFIDGAEIVNNDGAHGFRERSGTITLAPGTYQIEIPFFERFGGERLEVRYEGPSLAKQLIPFNVFSANCDRDTDNDTVVDRLDVDSDNDGIFDAVEAGHTQPHTNGTVNGSAGANGLPDAVENPLESGNINYTLQDSDTDGNPDLRILDSDGDGCSDANEAYQDPNADGPDNGQYGSGSPAATDGSGRVTAAAYGAYHPDVIDDSASLTCQLSDLQLEKTVNEPNPNVSDTVIFTVTLTNNGPDTATNVVIADNVPVGYTVNPTSISNGGNFAGGVVTWNLATVTAGDIDLTYEAEINAPTGTSGEYTNTVQVIQADQIDPDSAPNNDDGNQSEDDEDNASVSIMVSDLSLVKTTTVPNPNVGDTITFELTLTNDGPNDATNVTVEDRLPSGFTLGTINNGGTSTANNISWTIASVPVGSQTVSYEATIEQPANIPGEYTNTAQVTASDQFDSDSTPNNDDGDQSEDDESSTTITPQQTDLELINTISASDANPGDVLMVTVEVVNNGSDEATNVSIENTVPEGFTVTNINNGGTQTGTIITWNGLNVPSGTPVVLTFEVSVNIPTGRNAEYMNIVQVTQVDQFDPDSAPNNDDGDQSEDDEDNASILLIPADLSLTKALSAASIQNPNAGDTVTFELTLTNDGPGVATNVTLVDNLPSGFTLGTINNGGTNAADTITWVLPSVPVGTQTVSYEVTVNVPSNTINEYTNTAQVTTTDQYDPDSAPDNDDGDQSEDDEARFSIPSPTVDLEVVKTVDSAETFFEDTITFIITVTNNSTYEATNIGIEDQLPQGYVLVSTNTANGVYEEVSQTWEIPSIAPSDTAILEMTVTVTDIDDYTNIAELIYVDQIDPNTENDRGEATPTVTQSECLTVFNEFSPNNDGANDFFFIECIEQYPNNTLQVYNRWGTLVFEAQGYNNTWDGSSMGRATIATEERLPVGTYYYLLDLGNGEATPRTGWLYISR